MKKLFYFLSYIIVVGLVSVSCTNDENGTNSEKISKEYADAISSNVPANFDYNMYKTIQISIGTSQQYSDTYYFKVQVYDKNPLFNSDAKLLGLGVCKDDKDFTTSLDIPSSVNYVYTMVTNPVGNKQVLASNLELGSQINFKFEDDNTSTLKSLTSSNLRASSALSIFKDNTDVTINNASALDNFSYNDFNTKVIAISANSTIKISEIKASSNDITPAKIKVYGTLIIDKDLGIGNGGYIEVYNGGNISIENGKTLTFDSNSDTYLAVAKGGVVSSDEVIGESYNETSISLQMNNATVLYNLGLINVYNLNSNGADLTVYDGSVVIVRNVFQNRGISHKIENYNDKTKWAYIITKYLDLDNGVKLDLRGDLKICCENILNQYNDALNTVLNYTIGKNDVVFCNTIDSEYASYFGYSNEIDDTPVNIDFPQTNNIDNLFTFVSEDNYPNFGDYDMNDVVVELSKMTTSTNENNKIVSSEMTFTLKAYGATNSNGFAIQLDNINKNDIASVVVINSDLSTYANITNGMMNDVDQVVIPIFNNGRTIFNLNSPTAVANVYSGINIDSVDFKVTIIFSNPIDANLLSPAKLNPFIYPTNSTIKRKEIHCPGFACTSLSEESTMKLDGYMWALKIPRIENFLYPSETKSISKAYPKFINWIESNKDLDIDWYSNENVDKDHVYIAK